MEGLSKPPTQSEQADTISVPVGEEVAEARRRYLEEEHE